MQENFVVFTSWNLLSLYNSLKSTIVDFFIRTAIDSELNYTEMMQVML